MRYKIVTVRDRQLDVFGTPNFSVALGGSIRAFGDEINRVDVNNPLNKHPEDFDLYHLGEYDDETGHFDCLVPPKMIAIGKDYAK